MKISDRIHQISENERISVRALEQLIGCSNGVLSRSIKNGTDISSVWVSKIIEVFPKYSASWLLTGSGPMLNHDPLEHCVQEPVSKYQPPPVGDSKDEVIAVLKEQVSILKDYISTLKEERGSFEDGQKRKDVS